MDAVRGALTAAPSLNNSSINFGSIESGGKCQRKSVSVLVKPSLCPTKFDAVREGHGNTFRKRLAIRAQIGSTPQITPEENQQVDEKSKTKTAVPGLRDTVWDQLKLAVPSNPALNTSLKTDVVVVGAGIAGLSVAYNLAKAGKKVVVLEARAIGSGQTGKTTAHLMAWNDDYYSLLEKIFGEEKLKLVGESHRSAIDKIESVVAEESIDCNFKRVPGYLVAKEDSEEEAQKLRKEFESSRKAGFTDVKLENLKTEPKGGEWGMALVFPNCGEFQPLLYVQGLAKAIKEKYGGQIYENTAVVRQQGTTVTTSEGHLVSAGVVVLATNSPINKNIALHGRQYASRTYVVGLKVPRGTYTRATWWDTSTPYHNARLEDKGDHEVLVVGGEDHVSGIYPSEYEPTYEKLEEWARKHWPRVEEVEYRWTGQKIHPSDFLGFYGRNLLDPNNVYIASGDSGQEMTGGTIAGIVISSQILGQQHPWSQVYNPARLPPVTMAVAQQQAEVLKDDIEGFKNLLPLQGVDSLSAETVGRNCGAVIQEGVNKVACFRDDGGNLHRYSAICPHLGCAVKWNPKDMTFDCPCHGSYFDLQGIVINGPAKANLEPVNYN